MLNLRGVGRFLFIFLVVSSFKGTAQNQARLISPFTHIQTGKSFPVGIWIQLRPGWHTYWSHPGDLGSSPQIQWDLPKGVSLKSLPWPLPLRHSQTVGAATAHSFIYKNTVLLPFEVKTARDYSGEEVRIGLTMKWAVCEKICSIKSAREELRLTTAPDFKIHKRREGIFRKFQRKPSGDLLKMEMERGDSFLILSFQFKGKGKCLDVFPKSPRDFSSSPPEILRKSPQSCSFKTATSSSPSKVEGLLVYEKNNRVSAEDFSIGTDGLFPLALFALFAFLGGLILNFMPCVLPVIFLKLYNTLEWIEKSQKKILWLNLTYAGGVLVSFWVLALAVSLFQSAGRAVGWGFHLQSPLFVTFLALLFTFMGFYLLGLLKIPLPRTAVGFKGDGFLNHFITGVLSATSASPCTVPFMASAVGFALSRSLIEIFVVFSFLGLGLSFPYLILSFFPGLLKKLPSPGRKMELLKSAMAFPLFMVTVWLMYLLSLQLSPSSLFLTLMIFPLTGFAVWWGRCVRHSLLRRSILWVTAGLIVLLIVFQEKKTSSEEVKEPVFSLSHPSTWPEFSEEKTARDRSRGENVFVAFGAEWCLTCKTNERVFKNEEVRDFLKRHAVRVYYGDWTHGGGEIMEFLKSHNSWGVPFYVFFRGEEKTVRFPELLLVKPFLKKLKSAVKDPVDFQRSRAK